MNSKTVILKEKKEEANYNNNYHTSCGPFYFNFFQPYLIGRLNFFQIIQIKKKNSIGKWNIPRGQEAHRLSSCAHSLFIGKEEDKTPTSIRAFSSGIVSQMPFSHIKTYFFYFNTPFYNIPFIKYSILPFNTLK